MSVDKNSIDWINTAVSIWNANRIVLNEKTTLEKIAAAELELNFKFPGDFVEMYLQVNGFKNFDWNKKMFSLWSLERILKEFAESTDLDFIGFSDYLINSHVFGFEKPGTRIFKRYDLTGSIPGILIADSFQEVIGLINSGAEILY